MEIFHNDWAPLLNPELEKPYYKKLREFLIHEYRTTRVYPDMFAIFNALHYTSYADDERDHLFKFSISGTSGSTPHWAWVRRL